MFSEKIGNILNGNRHGHVIFSLYRRRQKVPKSLSKTDRMIRENLCAFSVMQITQCNNKQSQCTARTQNGCALLDDNVIQVLKHELYVDTFDIVLLSTTMTIS